VSGHVEFRWFAPDKFPAPFNQIFSGDLHWSVDDTLQAEDRRRSWCNNVFSDPADQYDSVWYDKLAFYQIGNGDLLTLDLRHESRGQVVYLTHDDGEGHGYVLAESFPELLQRRTPLACVGGEDWQWMPFVSSSASGLETETAIGQIWRELLGIEGIDLDT
jgi:hypothetical protein